MVTREQIIEACRSVYDPEISVNIYDLGLIYEINIDDININIEMTLTSPGCPVAGEMPEWVADAVREVSETKEVTVELVWDPPWGLEHMSDEAKLELGLI